MRFRSSSETLDANFVTVGLLQKLLADPTMSILLDSLPDGLIIVDRQGLIVFMNSAAESINELDASQQLNNPLRTFCKESVVNCERLLESFTNESKINRIESASDGTDILISTRFLRDKHNEIACFIVTQRNLEAITKVADSDGHTISHFKTLSDSLNGVETVNRFSTSKPGENEYLQKGLRAMQMKSRIMLTGESGVGKTEAAKYLHYTVVGNDKPFIHVNCSSIPETLFESEMFGYERGAFTGANQRGKRGLIEAADGGTLFLDEVGEVPMLSQPKLLQFIEEGKVQRLGATAMKRVKVNLITATNRDLGQMVQEGQFRKDLYYRISVIELRVPTLRERRELIPDLIAHYVEKLNKRRDVPFSMSAECMQYLIAYGYPGNIRELQNILEQLAVTCDDIAEYKHLPSKIINNNLPWIGEEITEIHSDLASYENGSKSLKESVREFEVQVIRNAIHHFGSKRKAATALGVDIATIVRKTK
ncbi:MAG: sigma 54-interacting transcriptional regulator [Pseudomonadales bacterium]|nr:sigma 54-interacting transcriptional regulator [Pseudomonadales bacterium]